MIFIKILQKMWKLDLTTSNHEKDRSFSEGKNKNVIMLMKDELGRKIMTKFVGLWAKTYS